MRILAVGGGSGGHVTPIAAVCKALVQDSSTSHEIRVWCDAPFYEQTNAVLDRSDMPPIRIDTILSGKFRRFHSMRWWQQLLRVRTIVWPNVRDMFKISFGIIQSVCKLIRWRPDVIFCKGGYVCLPVGIAAYILRIPIVIHDSDAHPGLTNKVLSRWAAAIATGTPVENYPYPRAKTQYIGVPIDARYRHYTAADRANMKAKLGFAETLPLVVITGGGLGAMSINRAISSQLDTLLSSTQVLLIAGERNIDEVAEATKAFETDPRFQLHGFIDTAMADVLIAADIVVARAGATTLLELAALGTPTVLVPNPYLTGGHQVKNARVYEEASAAIIVKETTIETNPQVLAATITKLVENTEQRRRLSHAMAKFAQPGAATKMALMILAAGRRVK